MNKKDNTPPSAWALRERIIDRYGSIRQFGIATGIERTQFYPILRGEALPGLRNFVAMAGALDLTLDELAGILEADPRRPAGR